MTHLLKPVFAVCLSGQSLPSGQWPCTKNRHTSRFGSRPNLYSFLRNGIKAKLFSLLAEEGFRILSVIEVLGTVLASDSIPLPTFVSDSVAIVTHDSSSA